MPLNALAIVVGIAIAYARIGVLPNWLFYPGELLFVVGTAFALWSMSLLGRYESAYVQVLPDHKVMKTVPIGISDIPGTWVRLSPLSGSDWPCSRGSPYS